jgi:RND family efflux transporter MFP subunit
MQQDQRQRPDIRVLEDQKADESAAPAMGETHAEAEGRTSTPGDPYRGPGNDDGGHGGGQSRREGEPSRRRVLIRVAGVAVLAVAGLLGYGYYLHSEQNASAQRQATQREDLIPAVRVQTAKALHTPREFHLPSTTQAFDAATLYARQSGYISQRLVDIGDRVKAGALLVVISAPEVDDQLNQARAQLQQMKAALEQAQANRSLAQVTNNRFTPLVQQGWETKQTGDQYKFGLAAQDAAVDVAKANIEAQKAQIARLERQQSYERVIAPFNGVITQRNIDIGSLVTADPTSGTPLFALVNTDVLRVQVYVPQDVALSMKPGVEASLEIPELHGERFKGTVTRTSHALDPTSRTLLVEVDLDNRQQLLRAGLYGIVHFTVPRLAPIIVVPSQAIIFNQNGVQVAVAENGKAQIKDVTIGEDDGATLQIAEGLKPGEDIILSPPAGLTNGAPVKVIKDPPAPI